MTQEDLKKEFMLHQIQENPEFSEKDMESSRSSSDAEWEKKTADKAVKELLKKQFEGNLPEFYKALVEKPRPSTENKIGKVRNKVSVTKKFDVKKAKVPSFLGNDEDFEEVVRETN